MKLRNTTTTGCLTLNRALSAAHIWHVHGGMVSRGVSYVAYCSRHFLLSPFIRRVCAVLLVIFVLFLHFVCINIPYYLGNRFTVRGHSLPRSFSLSFSLSEREILFLSYCILSFSRVLSPVIYCATVASHYIPYSTRNSILILRSIPLLLLAKLS